ncbi:MAG: DUF4982 domain-containing protein [Tannerellaceae bacterium]|jgi:beta-galactosidase|nr:DUF4982 domain-containing protein [Tannerellaceae bacterium]
MIRINFFLSLLVIISISGAAQTRREFSLEKNWKFMRSDSPEAFRPDFDDSRWQTVTVPHDWAIYGPFDGNADLQNVAITQDGETKATLKSGRTGGLPFIGVGWYRIRFDAPGFSKGQRAAILFDGAMSNARVYLNGHEIGRWPYGYNSFWLDMTDHVREKDNTLAVRLENLPESSRWYPGAGLYRNVRVILTAGAHIPIWGTSIVTPVVEKDHASVKLTTNLSIPPNLEGNIKLNIEIRDPEGQRIHSHSASSHSAAHSASQPVETLCNIAAPRLWTPSTPSLYTLSIKLYINNVLTDECSHRFGIRKIEIIPNKGMYLNGSPIKFRGVCNHHDLGPLGAAINKSALRRQLAILKDMGCNAIRTSHNMPAPELVELCDEMGFMMMVEAFDEWDMAKCRNGYNRYFSEWAEKDLINMIHNYRNHPSVVLWSIGNEVYGQGTPHTLKTARFLQDICHREDPTRLVTMGLDQAQAAIAGHLAAILDVAGFTYRLPFYQQAYNELPQEIVLGSETASTLSSRGVYHFPVIRTANKQFADHQCSSYDVEHCSWSNLPDDDFIHHDDYPWCIGEFVWTGFDYLGEPTPYGSQWPNHSSMFGIIDLAGLPKDRYYLYRSHWNREAETLHILPHWTWPGREGQTTPIFVYTSYPSAELFINGKSQGRMEKDTTLTVESTAGKEASESLARQRRYRLMWNDVKYEPGTVQVVAYDRQGQAVARREVKTAGRPHHIELTADRSTLEADGKDLSFITVRIVDRDGNLCPSAAPTIRFSVSGSGTYRAAANGDPTSLEPFHLPRMSAFNGQMVAIVQSASVPGPIRFEATAPGLQKATLRLEAK